ncbi:MAG: hypothetical protein NT014_04425 [Candidatus Omnitrophica bacterium]|nr:hypothetical protein [Candidatus Omnitrophota bacterium]
MIKRLPVIAYGALLFLIFSLPCCLSNSYAQLSENLELNLDLSSPTVSLPNIYKPSIDLSGRGKHSDKTLPQTLASADVINTWQADLGLRNFYRIQYNLWEIQQLADDKDAYQKLLNNYEEIIKKISDSGGTVILDLFGTPNRLGTVLDKNSAPHNLKAYKVLVKDVIRKFSCEKKYNIWYEVWNAPDISDFFLGQKAEYFNLYRIIGEAVKELRQETKIQIPLGGPSVSAWFRNIEPNNILSPERSLIYELIKYCYSYRLPLDFISWHAYSSDPAEEKQDTIYNKPFFKLIRDLLTYFKFSSNIPLLVDEWSFDGSANILAARDKNAYISASYIPGRLKNMYEAGIDYQTYFCLEDFGDNEVGAIRNLGIFTFDPARRENKGHAKINYNVWRLFGLLGQDLLTTKFSDDFVGVIPTCSTDYLALLIYNYVDPQSAMNYISHNIVYLNSVEQKAILGIIKSDRMKKILTGQLNLVTLRLSAKTKGMLSRAIELYNLANKFSTANRKIKISLKNVKDTYTLSQYVIDSSCSRNCEFKPTMEKDVDFNQGYTETVEMSPYSVQLLVFKKKPAPVEVKSEEKPEEPKAVEAKPEEKPAEVKLEIKTTEIKVEEKTAETKLSEKSVEAKSVSPAVLVNGSQNLPDRQTGAALSAEEKPVEVKPEEKPVEPKAVEAKPEEKPVPVEVKSEDKALPKEAINAENK